MNEVSTDMGEQFFPSFDDFRRGEILKEPEISSTEIIGRYSLQLAGYQKQLLGTLATPTSEVLGDMLASLRMTNR